MKQMSVSASFDLVDVRNVDIAKAPMRTVERRSRLPPDVCVLSSIPQSDYTHQEPGSELGVIPTGLYPIYLSAPGAQSPHEHSGPTRATISSRGP